MTSARPPRTNPHPEPRTEPVRTRSLAGEWDQLADSARTTRVVAFAAIVIALAGLGLAAWPLLTASPSGSCQQEAWDVEPATDDLPAGWTVAATQYDLSRKTMSFLGPLPQDEFSAQAQAISTITCFEQGAADAVGRSQQASVDAEQAVIERDDLGDQAFSAVDPSGATFLQLRSGRVVVYIAGSAEVSATQVDQLASAFDLALGGDGGDIAPVEPEPSVDEGLASDDPEVVLPEESQAAPDLVAMIPTQVDDLVLIAESATGSTFLGEDQGSRAVLATLRAAGREPDDLRVANAYDEMGASDLSVLVVTVDGLPVDQTREMVLDVWLAATGPGVTQEAVQLGGREFTKVDYGDGGLVDYVAVQGEVVLVITTADPALAEATAAALP